MKRFARTVVAFFLLSAAVQVALVIGLARWVEAPRVPSDSAWVLISPTGDRTWLFYSIPAFARRRIEGWSFRSRVIDVDTPRVREGEWTAIAIDAVDAGGIHFVSGGGYSHDEFLSERLTADHEQSPHSAFPSWFSGSRLVQPANDPALDPQFLGGEWGFGWPMVAASLRWSLTPTSVEMDHAVGDWAKNGLSRGPIPTKVHWRGAATNVSIGAALIALLRYVLESVRRWFRRTKGCCTACAYNLRGNTTSVCPECGTPVREDAAVV